MFPVLYCHIGWRGSNLYQHLIIWKRSEHNDQNIKEKNPAVLRATTIHKSDFLHGVTANPTLLTILSPRIAISLVHTSCECNENVTWVWLHTSVLAAMLARELSTTQLLQIYGVNIRIAFAGNMNRAHRNRTRRTLSLVAMWHACMAKWQDVSAHI